MGTPLGPKYIPYTYMDPLGKNSEAALLRSGSYALGIVAPAKGQLAMDLGFRV